jgi:hypothetical protein
MASGRIDLPRARVIRDAVAALDLSLARRIVATILPLAPTLTTGKLQTRLANWSSKPIPTPQPNAHPTGTASR